ncbi:MAG: carboxypeptidase regulatory-like domain-containing protein [Chloroflexi bacterium]|nr:carboxypeptidase regulatory-like domain-containing protein [Chloroflexota bacterium]
MQNVGTTATGVVVFFWGAYSNKCPTNDPGPINTACMRVPENAVWTLKATIPTPAKSAIVYSVATSVFGNACDDAGDAVGDTSAWMAWEDTYGGRGEPLAVIVQRKGSNDFETVISSDYPGITESMHGEGPPYQYFTPYAMRRYHNLYTVMTIQNSGDQCTPVSIYYKEQAPCFFEQIQRIEQLAPGESVRIRMPDSIKCEWLGSAYIHANQPLSIIVDQTSFSKYCPASGDRGTLLTYWAQPYQPAGDTLLYAGLLFRLWSGWQTGIQVQNLTQKSLPTFVTVNFMDNSGGELIFVGDWICPNGATTFFLPAITDLGFNYVGAADIQSHRQMDYPSGRETDGQPIFAVVDVKKALVYSDTLNKWVAALPGEAQGGAYNATPLYARPGWGHIALPSIAKSGEATSTIAIRNNSNCNRIQLRVNIHDQTGATHATISNLWLGPKHSRLIDLASIGTVASGFIGAGVVEVTGVEQLCDADGDGHIDPAPVLPSVIVVNKGHPAGDITTAYEGIPFKEWDLTCRGDIMGTVHSIDPCHEAAVGAAKPIGGVTVTSDDGTESSTDSTGGYKLKGVEYMTRTVTFGKEGFLTWEAPPFFLDCGEDKMLNAELLCLGDVGFKVVASMATDEDSSSIAGATVDYGKPLAPKAAHYGNYYGTSGTTDHTGALTLTVPILSATSTFTVSAPGIAESGVFTWTQMVNTPTGRTTNSIFGGQALNSRIYSDTTRSDAGTWYGFDDGSCANIGSSSRTLKNQDVELMLCGYGTVAGLVKAGGVAIPDQLVEVIVNGEVVGSATTGANGTYIIGGIPTRCFSTAGCADFSVRCMGRTENDRWEGCGDFERVDFDL